MNISDIQIRPIKYRLTTFNLIIPGYAEPYKVNDAHVGNFTIEKDFENYVFPYMEFRVIVPNDVYRDIMSEGVDLYVDLKIEYVSCEDFYEIESSTAKNMDGTIIDQRFYAFVDNKSPKLSDATSGQKALDKENDGELSQYSFNNNKAVVLALYRADHLFGTDQIINKVAKNATITDCMSYYLKKCGLKKVLMSPASNTKIYDELLLPPISTIAGMFRLARKYQMHKDGSIIFFDYDRIYILNKKLGATAWENNEVTTVYLTSYPNTSGDAGILKSGFYLNQREKYGVINIIGNQISVANDSMFSDILTGSNITLIDSKTGEISEISAKLDVNENSLSQKGKTNQVVILDGGEDSLQQIKSEMENAQNTLTISVQETQIQYLTPNKDFIFSTDNARYRYLCGHYRLVSMGAVFTKESSLYTSMFTATFVGGPNTISK